MFLFLSTATYFYYKLILPSNTSIKLRFTCLDHLRECVERRGWETDYPLPFQISYINSLLATWGLRNLINPLHSYPMNFPRLAPVRHVVAGLWHRSIGAQPPESKVAGRTQRDVRLPDYRRRLSWSLDLGSEKPRTR